MDVEFASRMREAEAAKFDRVADQAQFVRLEHRQTWDRLAGFTESAREALGVGEGKEIPGLSEAEAMVRRLASTDISRAAEILWAHEGLRFDDHIPQDLQKVLKEWRDLLKSEPNPDADRLATKAEEVRKRLEDALARSEKIIQAHGGNPPPEIGVTPKLMIAALGVEIGRQFASRAGQPEISRMYDRVSEDSRRQVERRLWPPEFRGKPEALPEIAMDRLKSALRNAPSGSRARQDLKKLMQDLPRVRDAYDKWITKFGVHEVMRQTLNEISFYAERFRDAFSELAAKDGLSERDRRETLGPIEALAERLRIDLANRLGLPPVVADAAPSLVRTPSKPDLVQPVDLGQRSALKTLSSSFESKAKGLDVVVPRSKSRELVRRAGEYNVRLDRYWSDMRQFAAEAYVLGAAGSPAELKALDKSLVAADAQLAKELGRWRDAISPSGGAYDGKLIADIGQNIFNIIDQASSPLRERLADIPKAEKEKRDAAWMVMNLQAFTGLAEQVGNGLADLAAGNKIPDVTRANEAVDLLNRSSADKFIEQLTKDTLHAEKVEVALQIYTPEKLSGLWDRQADIFKIDHKAPKAQRDALAKELKSIDAQYRTLKEQIKEIQTSAASKGELNNALDRVDNLRRELNRKGLSDAERADLIDRRDKATEALIEKVSEISRESAEANGKRLEDYQQMLTESTSHYESDRKQFWDSTWKVFSTTIDAANQKQLRKSLEAAFGSELPDHLKNWNKELGADKPRADKLQEYGTAVVSAIDSYLHKAELILGTTPALGEISDGLKAALNGIRLSVSKELAFQLEGGRFR